MKISTRIVLCILGGCALGANAQAATTEERPHPYKAIPATNVFRLKSPPPSKRSEPAPLPPPRIAVQGITTILKRQVLFKVTLQGKASEPAREIAYVLGEGERAGEIEVLEINERAGTARFRNHGIEQTLALTR